MIDYRAYLLYAIDELPKNLYGLCYEVIADSRFTTSPGGSEHHHNYKGGLIQHTAEVMNNAISLGTEVSQDVLRTAVIFHDFCKTKDYGLTPDGKVTKRSYRNLINHVSGSAAEFYHRACVARLDEVMIEKIMHCLLSHHGRREWGSPVEPLTAEAFILHAADMMSAKGIVICPEDFRLRSIS